MSVGSDYVKCALVCPNIRAVFLHEKSCHYTATSGITKGGQSREEAAREKGGGRQS